MAASTLSRVSKSSAEHCVTVDNQTPVYLALYSFTVVCTVQLYMLLVIIRAGDKAANNRMRRDMGDRGQPPGYGWVLLGSVVLLHKKILLYVRM